MRSLAKPFSKACNVLERMHISAAGDPGRAGECARTCSISTDPNGNSVNESTHIALRPQDGTSLLSASLRAERVCHRRNLDTAGLHSSNRRYGLSTSQKDRCVSLSNVRGFLLTCRASRFETMCMASIRMVPNAATARLFALARCIFKVRAWPSYNYYNLVVVPSAASTFGSNDETTREGSVEN